MTQTLHTPESSIEVEAYPKPAVGWYATIVLAFLYWMSLLDRFILSLLIEPIKADLGLTDVQFGLLQGIGFLLSFTFFGFIFGALADRKDRRRLIYFGVTLWSLASAACGLAHNFWHMFIARLGLGAGESSLNPSATSMLSDLFPPHRLTSAMAVYSIGATIGGGTALMLGGAIIVWVASFGEVVVPVLGPLATWQIVFFMVGLSTIPLAFLVFTFPEPKRRGQAGIVNERRGWWSAYSGLFGFIKQHPRFFFTHYVGFTVASTVVTGCIGWYPVHMMRAYQWGEGQVGLYLGMTIMLMGIVGKLATGWTVDTLYRRGRHDAQLRWMVICLLIAAPVGVIATTHGNAWVFLAMIGVFVALLTGLAACAMTSLNLVTPNELRGSGIALYSTVAGLLGGSTGTVLIPMASTVLYDGDGAIGKGMATLIGVACPLAALCLYFGMRPMREAMAASLARAAERGR